MISTYDVAVVGTGTMGSAAAYFLARTGLRVIAFEQFQIVHELGSHSGATRIIRHAYHESPDYVPLVLRADRLWQDMEKISRRSLLIRTGGMDLGPITGNVVRDALLACETHSLPHEHLPADEVMKRWPQFHIPEGWHACFDPNMGFLRVNECIRAYTDAARELGVTIHEEEPVLNYSCSESIRIQTTKAQYDVAKIVICSGAWNGKLLDDLQLPLVVKRKPLVWLQTENDSEFAPGRFPIFLADTPEGLLYGFPVFHKTGIKIANHHGAGPPVDPDNVHRNFLADDAADAQAFASAYLHRVTSTVLDGKICLYTMTPDEHFIVDLHPEHQNVAIAAGFSGHGFKFAPAIGEILSDLIVKRRTDYPIEKFRLSRFLSNRSSRS